MIKKVLIVVFIIFLIVTACQNRTQNTIRISGAWALFPMMNVWAAEYQRNHDVIIEISGGGAGKGMSDVLNGQVDIAMCSRPIREEEIQQGAFYLSVTKDAVIAGNYKGDMIATGVVEIKSTGKFTGNITQKNGSSLMIEKGGVFKGKSIVQYQMN